MITVLYITTDPTLGGSTASLYNLISSVKDDVSPIVLFAENGEGVDFFREHGIKCLVIPFPILYLLPHDSLFSVWRHPWKWNPIRKKRLELTCIYRVSKSLKGQKIDIVHSNTSPITIGVKLACFLKAKHIWHLREMLDLHFDFNVYGGISNLKKEIAKSDAVVAISNAVSAYWRIPKVKTFVINDAVRKSNDSILSLNKDKYILFMSYYLTEQKGVLFAIESFARSKLSESGFTLLVVGNFSDKAVQKKAMEAVHKNNLEKSIYFQPSQKEVRRLFENAAAFLMASRYEGFGRVTVESMFYGCPVVAHASGGTLDIVQDGINGYLFETEDECAHKLRTACLHDQKELITNAHMFAVNNFSEETYRHKILDVYSYVLSGHSKHLPLVSVIVPNYNHAHFLKQRINSILSQTYENYEVIILDDCSSDDSMKVIGSFSDNPHISHIVRNEDNGGSVFKQWEKGIHMSRGELIWIAESDDFCENNLLETLVDAFTSHPSLSFAYCTSTWVDETGKAIFALPNDVDNYCSGMSFRKNNLLYENSVCNASSALFRKDFALNCSRYTKFLSSGDYMFWIEMAEQGDVCIIKKGLNYFRRPANCLTGIKMSSGLTYREDYEIASYLLQGIKVSSFKKRLATIFKRNIISGKRFASDDVKKDLIDLWGGSLSNLDWLLLKTCRRLDMFRQTMS